MAPSSIAKAVISGFVQRAFDPERFRVQIELILSIGLRDVMNCADIQAEPGRQLSQ